MTMGQDMDNTVRFDGRADEYTKGRPNYSSALIDTLYREYGLSEKSVVADIGSGTGKFAVHLLERNSRVYCVEPNDDMRKTAERELGCYPGFVSVKGDAENTGLESRSVDLVTSAQAFHWFDGDKFRKECSRIIRGSGKVILIWNVRDTHSPINQDLYEIYSRYCDRFAGFSGGIVKDDPRIVRFFGGRYEYISFPHPLYTDREQFLSGCLSGSYSLRKGDRRYDDYLNELTAVFDRYSENGTVMIPYDSTAYIGTV